MAKILLLNCGSSSIKYQLLDPEVGTPEAVGIVQRIGLDVATIDHEVDGVEYHDEQHYGDHVAAVGAVVEMFKAHGPSLDDVTAVGHRAVHGGSTFVEPTVITDEVVAKMQELVPLAPLHNPPGIAGIAAAKLILPDVPHVAIFDTAFFSSLPAEAYTYAIDREVAAEHGIRRYGFHGTSHDFVSQETAKFLGKRREDLKMIVAHIGNGASMSAIDGGVAIDTSMGLTPLEGLVMGTRSGDVDPGLHAFLGGKGMSTTEIDQLLNKRSGLQGLAGTADMRDTVTAMANGDEDAALALDIYARRIVKYVGAYTAVLGGLDVLVFTAGVGENSAPVRERVLRRLAPFGVTFDEEENQRRSKEPRRLSAEGSSVEVLIVPTNEELAMARQVAALID